LAAQLAPGPLGPRSGQSAPGEDRQETVRDIVALARVLHPGTGVTAIEDHGDLARGNLLEPEAKVVVEDQVLAPLVRVPGAERLIEPVGLVVRRPVVELGAVAGEVED